MASGSLTEPAFFVLAALSGGARHGYAILGAAGELSGGRVQLRVGTLYGVLERLVTDGLVEPAREEVVQGRNRRYYRITDQGIEALARDAARQADNARVARSSLREARQRRPARAGRRASPGPAATS